jgi:microcystin-dependent protein
VLYSLIGTTYGGDGVNTFAVPDLRGRSPLSYGQGNGLSPYVLGQKAGTETVSLLGNQVGSHNHTLRASANTGTTNTPGTTVVLGVNGLTAVPTYAPPPTTTALAPNAIGPTTSGGQPHENRQPLQCINYIIAWAGIYPSRS